MLDIPFFSNEADATLDALNKSQASIEFSPDGKIITANDIFLRVMGYRELGDLGSGVTPAVAACRLIVKQTSNGQTGD